MSKLGFRSLCAALALMSTSAQFLTGCSTASHGESVAQTGSLSAALTTTGADGATYGFPFDAYLLVQSATTGEYIQLTGPETQINHTLPVGTYTASLYYGSGSVVLTRTEGAVTTTVPAEWTNPQPVTFDIVKGQTTPLALHFAVKGLVDLVFDTGTLQLIADVVEQAASQPGSAQVTGTYNSYYSANADDTAAYATSLAVTQGVDYPLTLGFQSTGTWTQFGGGTICVQGTLGSASAGGSPGLSLRLAELTSGSASVCVYDQGATDQVALFVNRFGAPPAGQETFLPDPNYYFYSGTFGQVGDVYDGTTLHQTALKNVALANGFFYQSVYDGSSSVQLTTSQGAFTGNLQLTP
jgi:hypothetical protein